MRRFGLQLLLAFFIAPVVAMPAWAGTHLLTGITDNSADTTVPVTDLLMVTITTSAGQGGNDATATTVSIGGTVQPADVASVSVYYQGLLVTTVNNPASLTDINISLGGNQKGGQPWTYFVSLNGSAAGKTFNMTVTTIAGSDDAVLPFTTQTRNATAAVNNPPTVTITAPADLSTFNVGDNITFTGTASDTEDGDLTTSLTWTSSIDGSIGSGGSFSRNDLSAGTHTITASVTDSGSLTGQDQITITVNALPVVTITSPTDASNFNQGDTVNFAGTATDTEDGTLTASLSWTSSIDGAIGSGGSFSRNDLSAGTHTITASVTDSDGASGQDQITITINALPVVTISSPTDASSFNQGDTVNFSGTATDTEDGTLTAGLSWTSSIDGAIGSGGSFSRNDLSPGTHTITASVTDSGGATGQDQITITIIAANNTPVVTITQPTNGSSFPVGTNVTFTGTASDTEDGDLTASLSWTSSIDGAIGSGGSFSRNNLSPGTHTITASVTDSGSATGQDQISITIVENRVTTGAPSALANGCDQITVSAPFTNDADNDSTTTVNRGTKSGGPYNTTVCSGLTGASPRTCVDNTVAAETTYYYEITFSDPDGVLGTNPQETTATTPICSAGNLTTPGSVSAVISSCKQITVTAPFIGDEDLDGSITVEYNTTATWPGTIACSSVSGVSPRQCLVTGLSPSTTYYTRTTFNDPDGFSGGQPLVQQTGPHNLPACTGDQAAPTITMLAPARGAVIGGTDTIKFSVYDADAISSAQVKVDGGAYANASTNANYACGTDCTVYEFSLDTTSLTNGSHDLFIRVTDATANIADLSWGVIVRNELSGKPSGGGNLLRRTHGSQLCLDCHALPTHSSQETSRKYGNWSIDCLTCHTPHKTRNIYLVREMLRTVNSGMKTIVFQQDDRSGGTMPNLSYLGDHTGTTYDDGICEACHTKTNHHRNDTSGGDHTHNQNTRCVDCHQHTKGFAGAGCNGCHNAPPDVGKHRKHDEVWDSTSGNTASSYTDTTSHGSATQYGYACAKCHSGTHDPVESSPYWVDVVFDNLADPKNPIGTFPAFGSRTADPLSPDEGATVDAEDWQWSNSTCSNLYCHSNASPVGGSNAYSDVTWNQDTVATPVACNSCHNTQARTDTGDTLTNLSTAHGKHLQSTSGETGTYSFKCDECHAATIVDTPNSPWALDSTDLADKREHVDGTKDVSISSAYDGDGIGTNNYSGGTCSDSYCHSPGDIAPGGGPFNAPNNTTLTWSAGTSNCRSCHSGDATAATTMVSGKHENHVDNTAVIGSNYECATCHNATVSAGNNEAITTFGNHVNGTKNVSGTLVDATYSSPTCGSSYCHSSGQDSGASFEYYTTPDWFTLTANALDCKGCHGRHTTASVSSSFGEPDYPNAGAGAANANSHPTHVSAATDCTNCHNATTTTGTSILASAPHTDQNRDIVIAGAWDTNGGTINYNSGTKTCNNIACHGAGTPQWGATLTCLNCHTGTEGGALGDGAPNAVDDEWATDGHGSAAGGSLTSALGGCDYCHQLDAAHTPTAGTNPYRLRYSATDNTLCLQCHAAGDSGIDLNSAGTSLSLENSTLNVDTAHFGTKHQQANNEGGEFCWDCHDPHGVPNNILMVKDNVSRTSDGTYGIPATTVSVDFTSNTIIGIGGFVQAANNGMCQACHDPNSGNGDETSDLGPTKYWRSDGTDDPDGASQAASSHNITKLCTNCHAHTDNFKGAGGGPDCRGCHGTGSQGGRRPVDPDFANGTSPDFRSHHVGNGASMGGTLNNFDCVVCHAEGMVISATSTSTDCPGAAVGTTCTNPTYHANQLFDLRDVDSWNAGDGDSNVFRYNKDEVATSAGAAGNWNSNNQLWREWTSGFTDGGAEKISGDPKVKAGLDRFCLSCHDSDGASQITNFRESTSQTATNPFADTTVTNNYDQQNRTRVIDIASMVVATSPADESGDPRGTNTVSDPPDGIYARHAIRGQSLSVYENTNTNWDTSTYWTTGWNSTSVMGCADCHTTDGANTTAGNAHGANSEYLLKDGLGTAYEGNSESMTLDTSTTPPTAPYGCYQCHNVGVYGDPATHTGSGQNFTDTTGASGSARVASGVESSIFGMACMDCHGGAPGNVGSFQSPATPESTVKGFGRIHGTSSIFSVGTGGAGGVSVCVGGTTPGAGCSRDRDCGGTGTCTGTVDTRRAYRFMNGGGLRYYFPGGWSYSDVTCYTLGSGDSWSSCAHHSGGTGFTGKPVVRPIAY